MSATEITSAFGEIQSYRWSARIRCNPSQLDDSFTVMIFCGSVPQASSDWESSSHLVGEAAFMPFGGSDAQGFVHLSEYMSEEVGLGSLREDVVVPYLKEKLNWRTKKVRITN
ncbi:hypothetical protein ONZ45_g9820 [Pleurotus djamor]|nr:hypothetical protein ONZ45_g9820 [Pleurotus djamor]